MDLGIAGKRAVVTGASTGMGRKVCDALAAEGVNLVLFARDQQRLQTAQTELAGRFGVEVDAVAGDFATEADIDRLAEAGARLGDVEILILNTPRPPSPMRDFLEENEQARWDQAYAHQLHGALLILRKITPLLLNSGWGRIVAITSASIKQPMPRHAVSTIFRAGLQAALKHVAMEVAGRGVTVNAVAPATVLTEAFGRVHDVESRVSAVPVGRAGTPEELAAVVAFLASKHAGFITGEAIQVDGGATLSLV